jgi:hypothetical protein
MKYHVFLVANWIKCPNVETLNNATNTTAATVDGL